MCTSSSQRTSRNKSITIVFNTKYWSDKLNKKIDRRQTLQFLIPQRVTIHHDLHLLTMKMGIKLFPDNMCSYFLPQNIPY